MEARFGKRHIRPWRACDVAQLIGSSCHKLGNDKQLPGERQGRRTLTRLSFLV